MLPWEKIEAKIFLHFHVMLITNYGFFMSHENTQTIISLKAVIEPYSARTLFYTVNGGIRLPLTIFYFVGFCFDLLG